MKRFKLPSHIISKEVGLIAVALLFVSFLLIYRLGSLTNGLAQAEVQASTQIVGWHGIYHNVLDLPLKFIRSIDFYLFKNHGQTLTRLPNVIFGFLSIVSFSYLMYLWHGLRPAILISLMFACSAWTLHVSRLASFDVLYFWGIITILLFNTLLNSKKISQKVWFSNWFIWGLLLTIPGFIWLFVVDMYLQRDLVSQNWKIFNKLWQRMTAVLLSILWIPLIVIDLLKAGQLKVWLGLPSHFPKILIALKYFVAVIVHLFIRGPEYPYLWLGKAPLLDVFTLGLTFIGVYFYAKRFYSARTLDLSVLFIVSLLLVGLNGAVSFGLMVPFAYIASAMGLSYLLHNWLKVFPKNPLARTLGVGLISFAVVISCIYNLRSYFIAWPNNPDTLSTFSRRL